MLMKGDCFYTPTKILIMKAPTPGTQKGRGNGQPWLIDTNHYSHCNRSQDSTCPGEKEAAGPCKANPASIRGHSPGRRL